VTPLGDGKYEVVLDHAIIPGAVTTIEYVGDYSFASYISHPGDVNLDGVTDWRDIDALLRSLRNEKSGDYDLHRVDIDHSGTLTAADLLRLIDLLNGGDEYATWEETEQPVNTDCPAAVGACCLLANACQDLSLGRCLQFGGWYWDPEGSCEVGYQCPRQECVGATGECCAVRDTPACEDPQCCTAVCAVDAFCCMIVWDEFCQPIAEEQSACHCPPSECVGATGDCCEANDSPGCDVPACCTAVCQEHSSCCSDQWSTYCTWLAAELPECGCPGFQCTGGTGACCEANGTPGCDHSLCCSAVCQINPFCCLYPWDSYCATLASLNCGCRLAACGEDAGACCVPNGTPGCGDSLCCAQVCLIEPSCCTVEWTSNCVAHAYSFDSCGCR